MAESEVTPPPKILVRTANGDLYLVGKNAQPEKKHSKDPTKPPQDLDLVDILNTTNDQLASHFQSTNPGVKLGLTVVDFDDQY
jgi:hypothetical protein